MTDNCFMSPHLIEGWKYKFMKIFQHRPHYSPSLHTVDAEARVVLRHLLGLDLSQGLDGRQATVLGQSQGDLLQGISEGSEEKEN